MTKRVADRHTTQPDSLKAFFKRNFPMLHSITVQLIFVAVATSLLLLALVIGHTCKAETGPVRSRL
jgi:hypothetical protein